MADMFHRFIPYPRDYVRVSTVILLLDKFFEVHRILLMNENYNTLNHQKVDAPLCGINYILYISFHSFPSKAYDRMDRFLILLYPPVALFLYFSMCFFLSWYLTAAWDLNLPAFNWLVICIFFISVFYLCILMLMYFWHYLL